MQNKKIDVNKCIGCRFGGYLFLKKKDKYVHVDVFSGVTQTCKNSDEISKYLIPNLNKGSYIFNSEMMPIVKKQEIWWENIIDLAYEVLHTGDEVSKFFKTEINNIKIWHIDNKDMENELLKLAKLNNIEILEEDYPDLLKYENIYKNE